ncbi:MAG: hypothetical protein ACRD2Z_02230 [Thermoanaerobaculia bacterium]
MNEETQTSKPGALARFLTTCRPMTARDRRNSWRATGWLFVWMVSFLATTFAIRTEALPSGLWTYLAIAASTALGIVVVLAYVRFVREADELQRKIQLEALAWGFAGGFVAEFAFSLIERAGIMNVDIGDPIVVMCVCYAVGVFLGARRYA